LALIELPLLATGHALGHDIHVRRRNMHCPWRPVCSQKSAHQ
jgi:hypothetical protein